MSARVSIRPLEERDLPDFLAISNRQEMARCFPHTLPYTEEQMRKRWRELQEMPDRTWTYSIVADDAWVGIINAGTIHRNSQGVQFGYYILPEKHGKGIGSQAIEQFVAQEFARGIMRLQTLVGPTNPVSRRVMEKTGFTLEGILQAYLEFQNRLIDVCLYARINPAAPARWF